MYTILPSLMCTNNNSVLILHYYRLFLTCLTTFNQLMIFSGLRGCDYAWNQIRNNGHVALIDLTIRCAKFYNSINIHILRPFHYQMNEVLYIIKYQITFMSQRRTAILYLKWIKKSHARWIKDEQKFHRDIIKSWERSTFFVMYSIFMSLFVLMQAVVVFMVMLVWMGRFYISCNGFSFFHFISKHK